MYCVVVSILLLTTAAQGLAIAAAQGSYSTTFENASAVLQQWTLSTECIHCNKNGDHECTQCLTNATTFGKDGMVHTTRKTSPSTSSCGAYSSSGHATWTPLLKYGNFTVVAKWFPGSEESVSTATGFIGLDSDGNEASITMGFHGDGWPTSGEGSHKYQHGIYADVKDSTRLPCCT